MTPDYAIRRGAADALPRLEPLWVSVHHRHVEAMPELAPYVDDATTWAVHSELYAELLAKPDTVLLLATAGDEFVGYGLAHVLGRDESWAGDTWVTGPRIGEIETVAVHPEHRGRGIGSELLDGLEREAAGAGCRGPRDRHPGRQRGRDPALRAPRLPPDLALPLALRPASLISERPLAAAAIVLLRGFQRTLPLTLRAIP